MGKTSNCLKMLQILSSGRVYKGQELADILETNVRNIAEYRTELEMAGYYIEGIPGKYGGYRLITQSVIPTVRLNEAEQRALSSGAEYLKSRNDFPYSSDYEKAMGKVFAAGGEGGARTKITTSRRKYPLPTVFRLPLTSRSLADGMIRWRSASLTEKSLRWIICRCQTRCRTAASIRISCLCITMRGLCWGMIKNHTRSAISS